MMDLSADPLYPEFVGCFNEPRTGRGGSGATHDVQCVRRFLEDVVPKAGVGTDRFEVQMLYGVPRDRFLADLMRQDVRCRLYVPFALGWDLAIEYLRRRLDEYPAMMWLVTKNMFLRR